jgi:hypothetical protein
MEEKSKTSGMLPSAIALNEALDKRLGGSKAPTMLTPDELELLRKVGEEIDEHCSKSERIKAHVEKMKAHLRERC